MTIKESIDDVLKRPYQENEEFNMSSTCHVALVVSLGLVCGVVVGARGCVVKSTCINEKTCMDSEIFSMCSFTSVVTFTENTTYSAIAPVGILRGVCSPGDRVQRNVMTQKMECMPFYPFPNALNAEIMEIDSQSPHERACGKWIKAGRVTRTVEHRSMEDHEPWKRVLLDSEDHATKSSSISKDSMSKFRAECTRTIHKGPQATRTAAAMAFKYLEVDVESIATRDDLIRTIGFMTGHSCDTPVRIGNYMSTTESYAIDVSNGWVFGDGVLAAALQLVDQPETTQIAAEYANRQINHYYHNYSNQPLLPTKQLNFTDIDILISGAVQEQVFYTHTHYNTHLINGVVEYFEIAPDKVKSYTKGIAAFCSGAMLSNVDVLDSTLTDEITSIKASRAPASAIGRLSIDSREIKVTNETIINATSITMAQFSSRVARNSDDNCLSLMRKFFPDHVDAARFAATVDTHLYNRMEVLTTNVRKGVQVAVLSSPISDVLANASLVAADVAVAGIRIAGAPRGTWAGISRAIPEPYIASTDGMFLMGLKQAHAMLKDRLIGLSRNPDPCDNPPLISATTLNAVIYPNLKCIVLFLGMAHRPWLDAQYDDTSLMSRGMMIIAHELAHLTLNTQYHTENYRTLLRRYRPSTFSEAIADVGAALGVIGTGVESEILLMNYCQLWCARLPLHWSASEVARHPENNERCDFLYETIMEHLHD